LRLCGTQLMLQTTIGDGQAFDPFAFAQDGLGPPEVDVSRREIGEALVGAGMVSDEAMLSRRHSSAMLSSPRSPSRTMRIFSSAENCRRVARRMDLIAFSTGCFAGPDFCLIFAPCGYDDPEILPKRNPQTVPRALTTDTPRERRDPWVRLRPAGVGRVGVWRGGGRLSISVSAPFVWRCLSGSALVPFPHPPHRTGQADFLHPALGQDFTPSSTARRAQAGLDVRARSARRGARVDSSPPCVA